MPLAEAIRESMSAIMDGEGNDMDLARVLQAVDDDPEARAYWSRLQQSRVMLNAGVADPAIDVSAAVRVACDAKVDTRRQAGPLASLAVAASVTLAVVMGGQQMLGSAVPTEAVQLPGGVVPVSGAAPVQARYGVDTAFSAPQQTTANRPLAAQRLASIAATPLSVAATPAAEERAAGSLAIRRTYEQLARDRYFRFAGDHAAASSVYQPNSAVPFARLPQGTAR